MKLNQLPKNLQKQVINKGGSKYGNQRTNGFDSKKEAQRYAELKILERAGIIKELRTQVPYELIPKNDKYRAVAYVADFVYIKDGKTVVEDSKGFRTDVYKIKKKLMYHVYGIEVIET